MKKVAIFVGLAIATLSAIVFVPWGVGLLVHKLGIVTNNYVWVEGFKILVFIGWTIMLSFIGYLMIQVHWKWAKRLAGGKKSSRPTTHNPLGQ